MRTRKKICTMLFFAAVGVAWTASPATAQERFRESPQDPLWLKDNQRQSQQPSQQQPQPSGSPAAAQPPAGKQPQPAQSQTGSSTKEQKNIQHEQETGKIADFSA